MTESGHEESHIQSIAAQHISSCGKFDGKGEIKSQGNAIWLFSARNYV